MDALELRPWTRGSGTEAKVVTDDAGRRARAAGNRDRIVDAAIGLYREIGHEKTAVADIACEASMSSANVYRYFPSRQAIEDAIVANLLDQVIVAATAAARGPDMALQRLAVVLSLISQMHADRAANDGRLHELVAVAAAENWPVALSYTDRIRGIVRPVIAAGQATGELRLGSPLTLTCCLLEAMDTYLSPSRIKAAAVRPSYEEMMSFCASALASGQGVRPNAAETPATLVVSD